MNEEANGVSDGFSNAVRNGPQTPLLPGHKVAKTTAAEESLLDLNEFSSFCRSSFCQSLLRLNDAF